jgi:hypothetical protein
MLLLLSRYCSRLVKLDFLYTRRDAGLKIGLPDRRLSGHHAGVTVVLSGGRGGTGAEVRPRHGQGAEAGAVPTFRAPDRLRACCVPAVGLRLGSQQPAAVPSESGVLGMGARGQARGWEGSAVCPSPCQRQRRVAGSTARPCPWWHRQLESAGRARLG